jgi:polar amino acid transport system substrate-binding protein
MPVVTRGPDDPPMKQIVQDFRSGAVRVVDVPPPMLSPRSILVATAFSAISPGTERSTVTLGQKSLAGKAVERPDLVARVLDSVRRHGIASTVSRVRGRLESWKAFGYSAAGWVEAVGEQVDSVRVGDRVACAGAEYAVHAEVLCVPVNLCAKVPEGVRLEDAAFTTLGAIALHGVRQARVGIGERVAVIGLGLIGQLVCQILRAGGCRVFGIDIEPEAATLAGSLGAEGVAVSGRDDIGAIGSAFTQGDGVDAVIVTAGTKDNAPVVLAGELARDRARIVVVGATRIDIPRETYYAKELEVTVSRSYGPGRYDPVYEEKGVDYPIGFVRWTEQRNMEGFLALLAAGQVRLDALITHTFPVAEGPEAYRLVSGERAERSVGILLRYSAAAGSAPIPCLDGARQASLPPRDGQPLIGVIGAGNHAQAILLPALARTPEVRLGAICTRTGTTASRLQARYGAGYATTDYRQVLDDPGIDAVLVATRHDSHARIVCEALARRKPVFVEKPLALTEAEIGEIEKVWADVGGQLMVGFNRRFAPLAERLKAFLADASDLPVVHYRVNAGPLQDGHWLRDPEAGGGRVLGEVCHFVDFLIFLLGGGPVRVTAEATGGDRDDPTVAATLRFASGALGSILYATGGNPALRKERIEVFGGARSAVLDDFRSLTLYHRNRRNRRRSLGVDKGHARGIQLFMEMLRGNRGMPISMEELCLVTRVTLGIREALRTGRPVEVGTPPR